MGPQDIAEIFLQDIRAWYESERTRKGRIYANRFAVGLLMLDHMAVAFPFLASAYTSPEVGQVKDASGPRAAEILARYGETRRFTREGGRSSRGSIPVAHKFASVLNGSGAAGPYKNLNASDQQFVRERVQSWIVDFTRDEYFNRQRIAPELDYRKPIKFSVEMLLKAAREHGGTTTGAVAQYLVGAKLSLRFPDQEISNESYTTADQQTDRPGDFLVGDTAIHVTMSPGENLISNRCRANIRAGFRPLVLVPEALAYGARQLVETANLGGQVAVVSIEDFVGTNVEEIAAFTDQGIRHGLKDLLMRYNERVEAVEPDPSLLIAIPANL